MATSPWNAVIAFPNYVVGNAVFTPTFSGGSWNTSAPLTNLQNPYTAYSARSTDTALSSTLFTMDMQTSRDVLVFAIPKHNLSLNAVVSVSFFDATNSLVSTTTVEAFPCIYAWGDTLFEDEHWFTGTMTYEEWKLSMYPMPVLIILPSTIICRYITVSINDPGNEAGYIQLSSLFVAPGWQPTYNFTYNSSISVQDNTIETVTIGSASIFDQRAKQRVFSLSFLAIPKNESFIRALDGAMRQGKSGQFLLSLDPTDVYNRQRLTCVCTQPTPNQLAYAFTNYSSTSFTFREVVA